MTSIVHVPQAEYDIGDDSIPNASPRHRRRLDPFWIDERPVSWAHFETFVAAGAFADDALWQDPQGADLGDSRPQSIDDRCRQLLPRQKTSRHDPITGLTWFEALALARFFGGRLAFEAEWETAMSAARGIQITIGRFQEWTADAFTPRYWRADFDRIGVPWLAGSPADVVVRGAAPEDLYHHRSMRIGRPPGAGHPHRAFRRVWDTPPPDSQIIPAWRD